MSSCTSCSAGTLLSGGKRTPRFFSGWRKVSMRLHSILSPGFQLQDWWLCHCSSGVYSFEGREWEVVTEAAKDMIAQMLVLDFSKRATAKQLCQHRWFQVLSFACSSHKSLILTKRCTHALCLGCCYCSCGCTGRPHGQAPACIRWHEPHEKAGTGCPGPYTHRQ